MQFPDDRRYTAHDEWVMVEGNIATIGITAFAQDQLGELVHVELPAVGDEVTAGQEACEIESVKAVAELYSPVTGTITAVNDTLDDEAEQINQTPYDAWIFKVDMANDAEVDGLLDAAAYAAKVSD